jgi:hypothetical protein
MQNWVWYIYNNAELITFFLAIITLPYFYFVVYRLCKKFFEEQNAD